MKNTEFYEQILGRRDPWLVEEVAIDAAAKIVVVRLG